MVPENPTSFPVLSPSQRLHLDIYGYVIVRNLINPHEVESIKSTLYRFEADFEKTGQLPALNCFHTSTTKDFYRIDNLPHLSPAFFDYVTHPLIVGMAMEIVGGPVRLQQSDAHIRRPLSKKTDESFKRYQFHRGINPAYHHFEKGLYHFSFIKALTNLTDLGPEDGGTTVIAGTHKISQDVHLQDIIDAALDDPSMIHQIEAPAGSTLLFYESLVHAAGIIRSDKDRLLILGGYMPTMFQAWSGYDPDPDFVKSLKKKDIELLTGANKFNWPRRSRDLGSIPNNIQ